jgi:hypothetical protein
MNGSIDHAANADTILQITGMLGHRVDERELIYQLGRYDIRTAPSNPRLGPALGRLQAAGLIDAAVTIRLTDQGRARLQQLPRALTPAEHLAARAAGQTPREYLQSVGAPLAGTVTWNPDGHAAPPAAVVPITAAGGRNPGRRRRRPGPRYGTTGGPGAA